MSALAFFPVLYPDELLYSGLARYHIRSANREFRQTDRDLFGSSSEQACRVTQTNNLRSLVARISRISNYKLKYLIECHTLYPFYAAFLTQIEIKKLLSATTGIASGSILERAKVDLDSYNDRRQFLKFCPQCFEGEIGRYGEAYWHRTHQIPGFIICPQHQALLLDSQVSIYGKGIHYYAASVDKCQLKVPAPELTSESSRLLLAITEDLQWLMNVEIDFKGMRWLRDRYLTQLYQRGLLKKRRSGEFDYNISEIFNDFCSFYGRDFLNLQEPRFLETDGKYLIHCLLSCDLDPKIDRLAHILIIRYLAGSVANFFTSQR